MIHLKAKPTADQSVTGSQLLIFDNILASEGPVDIVNGAVIQAYVKTSLVIGVSVQATDGVFDLTLLKNGDFYAPLAKGKTFYAGSWPAVSDKGDTFSVQIGSAEGATLAGGSTGLEITG